MVIQVVAPLLISIRRDGNGNAYLHTEIELKNNWLSRRSEKKKLNFSDQMKNCKIFLQGKCKGEYWFFYIFNVLR